MWSGSPRVVVLAAAGPPRAVRWPAPLVAAAVAGAPLMVGDFQVTGAEEMAKLGRDLTEIGTSDLKKGFAKEARRLGRPAGEVFKRVEVANLPHRGGLGATVAGLMATTTVVKFKGQNIGISFRTRYRGHDMRGLEAGTVRYPLFGDRTHWYSHPVPPNLILGAVMMMRDDVRAVFLRAVDEAIAKLRAGGP